MKVRPLHDRVVLERLEKEDKTSGGIIIPDNAKQKPVEAILPVQSGRAFSHCAAARKSCVRLAPSSLPNSSPPLKSSRSPGPL